MESYEAVSNVIETLKAVKINIDREHKKWFSDALELAASINVKPCLPPIVSSMKHRSNIPGKDEEEFYRRNISIPIMDEVT